MLGKARVKLAWILVSISEGQFCVYATRGSDLQRLSVTVEPTLDAGQKVTRLQVERANEKFSSDSDPEERYAAGLSHSV